MAFVLQRHKVVVARVAAHVAVAAVVVIPVLQPHLQRYKQRRAPHDGTDQQPMTPQQRTCPLAECRHAHAAPNGKCIKRACIGVVALTGFNGCLVQIDHNGQPRHEEKKGHHPELLLAPTTASQLPRHAQKAQKQGQSIIDVVAAVLPQAVGQQVLVAQQPVVYPAEARQPVAVLGFTEALHVVLPPAEVPHEVAPIHPVALIGEEEAQVLPRRGHLHRHHFAAAVVDFHPPLYSSHPCFIAFGMSAAPHAWEEHVLGIHIMLLVACHDVLVCFITLLWAAPVFGCPFFHFLSAVAVLHKQFGLRRVYLTVNQGSFAILVASQIARQGKDVVGGVLIHWRVGASPNHHHGIATIANEQHEQAERNGVEHTPSMPIGPPHAPPHQGKERERGHPKARIIRTFEPIDE